MLQKEKEFRQECWGSMCHGNSSTLPSRRAHILAVFPHSVSPETLTHISKPQYTLVVKRNKNEADFCSSRENRYLSVHAPGPWFF
jgi:hypothetical protein